MRHLRRSVLVALGMSITGSAAALAPVQPKAPAVAVNRQPQTAAPVVRPATRGKATQAKATQPTAAQGKASKGTGAKAPMTHEQFMQVSSERNRGLIEFNTEMQGLVSAAKYYQGPGRTFVIRMTDPKGKTRIFWGNEEHANEPFAREIAITKADGSQLETPWGTITIDGNAISLGNGAPYRLQPDSAGVRWYMGSQVYRPGPMNSFHSPLHVVKVGNKFLYVDRATDDSTRVRAFYGEPGAMKEIAVEEITNGPQTGLTIRTRKGTLRVNSNDELTMLSPKEKPVDVVRVVNSKTIEGLGIDVYGESAPHIPFGSTP